MGLKDRKNINLNCPLQTQKPFESIISIVYIKTKIFRGTKKMILHGLTHCDY